MLLSVSKPKAELWLYRKKYPTSQKGRAERSGIHKWGQSSVFADCKHWTSRKTGVEVEFINEKKSRKSEWSFVRLQDKG